jgi:outer membrane protein assembly factor BamA
MKYAWVIVLLTVFWVSAAAASEVVADNRQSPSAAVTEAPSKFTSSEDGWLDVSGFLDQTYGFVPLVVPITEPAVGYGAAGGLIFVEKTKENAPPGFGRPNITTVGGLGTENGTWGVFAGDSRYWMDDRVQTLAGAVYASVNLDFYGIGNDAVVRDHPIRYNLEPAGGVLQAKYRLGDSRISTGIGYVFAVTKVSFDASATDPRLPVIQDTSSIGGALLSVTFDSRDNIFTPLSGTYLDLSTGLFSQVLGSDDDFQRVNLAAMQFVALGPNVSLGGRASATLSFGEVPFYLRPFVALRGVQAMRYQGEYVTQLEAELRWQFWKRFSVVGFGGVGVAWNDFERVDDKLTVTAGGAGFRYELARKYGLHMGLDVAFGPDSPVIYVQFGSAWARP